MRVLITGASGFIGQNVVLKTPRDWEVTALYHRTETLERLIAEHSLTHVRAVRCDLLSESDVRALARRVDGTVDAVLYLAANGDPAASTDRPRWDLESNTTALVNFLGHVAADHLVYLSSGAVYDGLQGDVTPTTTVAPRLPYAISKLASEHYVRFFAERTGRLNSYCNVRFFGAYGPYEADRKITTRWLRAMTAGQREFVIRGNGENLIDFMFVDDAVDGILKLLRAGGESLTLDFASGMPVSVNAVVQAMARVAGVPVSVRHEGTVAEYIEFRSVDRTMRDRFALSPSTSFEEGLRRLQAFLARQPHPTAQPQPTPH